MEVGEGDIRKQLVALRIVVVAMAMGVVVLAALAVVLGPLGSEGERGLPRHALSIACVALMVVEAVAYPIIRGGIVRRVPVEDGTPNRAAALKAYSAVRVVGCAMAEGVALFGGVVVLLEGVGLNILLVAIPLAALIAQLPTTGRWKSFLESVPGAQVR